MNNMNIYNKIKIQYLLSAVLLLFFGGMIYIVFRRETYLHTILPQTVNHTLEQLRKATESNCVISFMKYYLVDYLWGLALSLSLFSAVDFRKKSSVAAVCAVSTIWGMLFELAQLFSLVKGTFDFADILMYILAALTAALINNFSLKRMV